MPTDFLHGVEVVTVTGGPRPIQTVRSAIIGIVGTAEGADEAAFPLDTPVLINSRGGFGTIGTTGTLPGALANIFTEFSPFVVVIRVAEDADDAVTLANVVGAVDAGTGVRTGIQALKDAQAIVGVTPMLLIAPGFTSAREADVANPGEFLKNAAAAALESVATALRAHAIIAGPNTTDADAMDYVTDFGTRRTYVVDPFGMVFDTTAAAYVAADPAAAVAGLIARVDAQQGFWKSPSNEELLSVGGVARPVDFAIGDPNTRANLLNENNVATIIRDEGYRLWGNRTTSADPQFAFLCVSRTADMIDLSIQQAHRWACDKGITRGYFDDVTSSVNAYLRDLEARGAIVGGKCWVDPDFNDATQIANGHATFSYEFTPTYPAERVTFRSSITDAFITNLFPAN